MVELSLCLGDAGFYTGIVEQAERSRRAGGRVGAGFLGPKAIGKAEHGGTDRLDSFGCALYSID